MLILGYILLFIVCLSTLIMVHEAGHLATAKMFKVYCFEYSIGFGPKIFKVKRKKGETYFSLRCIPFGGYVSMYGESETLPEGLEVDPNHSLENIKKWKKAIIMVAGVTMNMVLALVIFFIYEVGFPKYVGYFNQVQVAANSKVLESGVNSGDKVYAIDVNSCVFYDDDAQIETNTGELIDCSFGFPFYSLSLKDTSLYSHTIAYKNVYKGNSEIGEDTISIADILNDSYDTETTYTVTGFVQASGYKQVAKGDEIIQLNLVQVGGNYKDKADKSVFFSFPNMPDFKDDFKNLGYGMKITVIGKINKDENGNRFVTSLTQSDYSFKVPDFETPNLFAGKLSDGSEPKTISYKFHVNNEDSTGKGDQKSLITQNLTPVNGGYILSENPGVSMVISPYYSNYGTAVKNTFTDFGESAVLIFKGIGGLFTDINNWQNVGGIVAVGVMTTRTLEENGFGQFLYYWAVISVNLAIVNLFPFPGLDGWHLVVTGFEGATKKKIPTKVKSVMSIIGIAILFALMIAVIIKDIIMFI